MLTVLLAVILGATDPWQSRFPNDDVVVVEHETRISILPDGRSSTRVRRVTRPLTIVGREDHSDIRIRYFEPRQRMMAIRCGTSTADGGFVEARPHAFNIVTPGEYGTTPDFLRAREMVVSPPAVAENTEIILEYELIDSVAVPWFEDVLPIGETYPVLSRTIRIENLTSIPVRWTTLGIETDEPSDHDGTLVWSFRDIPAYPEPRRREEVPRLVVSTCAGWAEMASWFASSLPGDERVPPEATDSLRIRLRQAVTRHDSLRAVAGVAAQAHRVVPAPDRRFWVCRSPEDAWARGYVEPLEMAWLIAALARAAGLHAYPCLVGEPLDDDVPPAVTLLSEPSVRVEGTSPCWLDRQGLSASPSGEEGFSFLPLASDSTLSAGPPPAPRRGRVVLVITPIRADSLHFRGSASLSASLVPADASPSAPEAWYAARVKRSLAGSSPSFRITLLHDREVAYEFEGTTAGPGIWIDCGLRTWFGDGWLPPGTSPFDVLPRARVLVPADVDLTVDLRIVRAPNAEVQCLEGTSTAAGGGAELSSSAAHTEESWRIVHTCTIRAGWRTPQEVAEIRRILGAEGSRRASAAFLMPPP